MTETLKKIGKHLADIEIAKHSVSAILVGKTIRITTPFWCDQPIGCTKPNQSGKKFTVKEVFFGGGGDDPHLFIGDFRCSIKLKDVEVID